MTQPEHDDDAAKTPRILQTAEPISAQELWEEFEFMEQMKGYVIEGLNPINCSSLDKLADGP